MKNQLSMQGHLKTLEIISCNGAKQLSFYGRMLLELTALRLCGQMSNIGVT